ncbi:UNVERIFIED_CONTAM: hypothetical protein FKN15_073558 [Acipenser sinensis]
MALLHFSSALSILCCLLTAGGSALLEKNMAVLDEFSAFDWSNCGVNDPFVVNSLSISSPIRIPGPLTIGLSGTLKVPVHAPLKLEVEIKKKVWGIWFKLPCEDNYGSCTYNDVCEMLDKMFPEKTCPSTLQFHNVPCHCPVAPAEINIPTITLDIPKVQLPAFLADGEYWLQIKASSGAEQIACFSTTIAVKAT